MSEKFFIPVGEEKAPSWTDWFEDRNPADTRDVIGLFPSMEADDVRAVIDAAERAFPAWRSLGYYQRGVVLRRAAELLRSRLEALAAELSRELGKTLREARGEVSRTADFFEYYGAFGRWPTGDLLPDERQGVRSWSEREPLGVVAAIAPWNDPLLTPARKLAPALIAGNAVVLKPASATPLVALRLLQVLEEAGLPRGTVGLVTGRASTVGSALLRDERVRAVTFTGSTATGMALHEQLAGRNVRLQTEMGGKNAVIVAEDANLGLAVEAVIAGGYGQAGQRCTATSRVIVVGQAYEPFLEALRDAVGKLRVGPGTSEETDMGPVVDQEQLEKVMHYVELGHAEGGRVVVGGQRLADEAHRYGFFVQPTVIADVTEDMTVWRDEIFGPVVSVLRVGSVGEAISAMNRSRYGLSGAIFTRSLETAHKFIEEADVGCVSVNLPTTGWNVHMPFGGFKDSGSPFKEQGIEGLQFYTRVKTVAMRVAGI